MSNPQPPEKAEPSMESLLKAEKLARGGLRAIALALEEAVLAERERHRSDSGHHYCRECDLESRLRAHPPESGTTGGATQHGNWTVPCGCEGCPKQVPACWASGMCWACANEDCDHDGPAVPPQESAPTRCETCSGRGWLNIEVNGLFDGTGPCPDCAPNMGESAPTEEPQGENPDYVGDKPSGSCPTCHRPSRIFSPPSGADTKGETPR